VEYSGGKKRKKKVGSIEKKFEEGERKGKSNFSEGEGRIFLMRSGEKRIATGGRGNLQSIPCAKKR